MSPQVEVVDRRLAECAAAFGAMPSPPLELVRLPRTTPDAAQRVHGAEPSAAHHLERLLDESMPSHVEADHHHPVGAGRARDEPIAVGERESGGRVDPDVQPRVERGDGGVDLTRGGKTERDDVQATIREQLVDVVVAAWNAEALLDVRQPLRIHVRSRDDIDLRDFRERGHVLLGRDLAAAGEANSESFRH